MPYSISILLGRAAVNMLWQASRARKTSTSNPPIRSASAMASAVDIRSPLMVSRSTICNCPPSMTGDRQCTVDQRRLGRLRASLEGFGHGRGPADFGERTQSLRGTIGAEHDVGVQHRQQRFEVAFARGREKRVDDASLRGRTLRPAGGGPGRGAARGWRAGAPLPACGRRSARSRRTTHRTCRAARTRSARPAPGSRSTTSSARPTESASTASCSGSMPSSATIGRGRARPAAPRAATCASAACRGRRARPTVVSQPPRFSTSLVRRG